MELVLFPLGTSPARVCASASAMRRSTRTGVVGRLGLRMRLERALQELCRFLVRERGRRAFGSTSRRVSRLRRRRLPSGEPVRRNLGERCGRVVRVETLEGLRHAPVDGEAPRAEIGVEDLAEQAVREGESHRRRLREHSGRRRRGEPCDERIEIERRFEQIGERRRRELATDHRGHLERRSQIVGQAREVRPDRGAHAVGDA